MSELPSILRERQGLKGLNELIAYRAALETRIDTDYAGRTSAAEKEFQDTSRRIIAEFEAAKESAQEQFQKAEADISRRFAAERAAQDRELQQAKSRITGHCDADAGAMRTEYQKSKQLLEKHLQAQLENANVQLAEAQDKVADARVKVDAIQADVDALLKKWRQTGDFGPQAESEPGRIYQDAFKQLIEDLQAPQDLLRQLTELSLPTLFQGLRVVALIVFLLFGSAGAGAAFAGRESWLPGLGIGALVGVVLTASVVTWLYFAARGQVARKYLPLRQALGVIEATAERAEEQAREAHKKLTETSRKRFERELQQATEKYEEKISTRKALRDRELRAAQEKHEQEVGESTARRDADKTAAHEKYQKQRSEVYARYESDSQELHQKHYRVQLEARTERDRLWSELTSRWHEGLGAFHRLAQDLLTETRRVFPAWADDSGRDWTAPACVPAGMPFGTLAVDLASLPQGLPSAEILRPTVPTRHELPALLCFPGRSSLLMKAGPEGHGGAITLLQALMFRFANSLPPGKVRFTIIDPIGLGENFAGFMHLADYDDALVNSRIWTEPAQIEQRLADLTAHMENVLQMYLRNQYETIEQYNEAAGEVAEPFRIAIIANFPANFTGEAARRLLSIVNSGARCGVYALIFTDLSQTDIPHGFNLAALEQQTTVLEWSEGRFRWCDDDFKNYPLSVECPPPVEFMARRLHQIGAKAREAKRVEVPFEFIMPQEDKWWTADSRGGIDVPLGRAGATKRQHLQLGKGTAQHVLVSGKTGSGKSTLLHALITNASLLYNPQELELYLIDFKKGVEFKTYATHELPHARVVAIESDREFGLSVLQRLDAELRERGEKFRQSGSQDLRAYRDANGSASLSRILLIVDEFQEFFLEDDRISQEAAQLLDGLVRQGRAFGLHVLLGSQTLGGAYTLARSTIDQMAVRIALQCSESDAQLILNDENVAARLLSRPGEAIYNDANGLVEGNNPFQVVWLSDSRREAILRQIQQLATRRQHKCRRQIVFEGSAPADLDRNELLYRLLDEPGWQNGPAAYAWLGEAMAIKEPTAAVLRRQTGSHVLVIGQNEEAARGVLATAIISLAVQHSPANDESAGTGAVFHCIDTTPADHSQAEYFARLSGSLPHAIRCCGWREMPQALAQLAAEIERRQASAECACPEIYVLLFGLHRLRDLRRDEDEFSFSSEAEQKPKPGKHLATILREGAGLGVHVLAWCDTLINVNRAFDRQTLREFEMHILFQMSANDSSTLIDSPAAGRLGPNRALYHHEGEGKLEKFRPYGLPNAQWLRLVKDKLGRKQPGAVTPA